MDIIPFEAAGLPAYLKAPGAVAVNDDLTAHASTGFPVISIKGKVFAVVRDGERQVLPNPKDPDSPATYIEVVLVKANKGTSKVWYAKGYQEGAENQKPDCFSNDGVKPDAAVENPVSRVCATCPKNQWGSRVGENASKGKACADSVRLAISTPGLINDPYLLRVPPASIKSLGEYGKMLAKRGVAYNTVVTKISFDMEQPTPKLMFKPMGFLPETVYREVVEVAAGDVVEAIMGTSYADLPVEPATAAEQAAATKAQQVVQKAAAPVVTTSKDVTTDEVVAAVQPKVKAAAKPAATPAPQPVVDPNPDVEVAGLDLDDLNFDD